MNKNKYHIGDLIKTKIPRKNTKWNGYSIVIKIEGNLITIHNFKNEIYDFYITSEVDRYTTIIS